MPTKIPSARPVVPISQGSLPNTEHTKQTSQIKTPTSITSQKSIENLLQNTGVAGDIQQTANFAKNVNFKAPSGMQSLSLQIAQGTGKLELQPEVVEVPRAQIGRSERAADVGPITKPSEAQKKEQVIKEFYSAMENKDYDKIMSLYHPDAVFTDPAFPNISGDKLKGMWKLITGNESLKVNSRDVKMQSDGSVTGHWDANYELIKDNHILNQVDSKFEFKDGKIIKHTDSFNFSKWADQAFPGILGKAIGSKIGQFVFTKLILPFAI